MPEYTLSTKVTWRQTRADLQETFRLWGVSDWSISEPRGALWTGWQDQTIEERTVDLTYMTASGQRVTLSMGDQRRAVDNLRVLYLAVEAIRLNEKRGIGEVVASAYLQIGGATLARDPYEVLGIVPGSPIAVAEAVYKALALEHHPDKGGDPEKFKELKEAIQNIRGKTGALND